MSARLMLGDCLEVLRTLESASIDAIVTDPPYELAFMGRAWDASGIAFSVDLWREALRVLKPGGHLLAFGGTRTYHRMTCAIEDAGFEVRDCLMWVYGSGFPKSLDVSKAIDKAAGAEREVIGRSSRHGGGTLAGSAWNITAEVGTVTAPATDAAKTWSGWGTALKPAWEPIVLARKPLDGTVAGNVLKHGTGAINVDGCRAGDDVAGWGGGGPANKPGKIYGEFKGGAARPVVGRWPANIVHDGSEVVTSLFPSAPGQIATTRADGAPMHNAVYGALNHGTEAKEPRQDATDSAARFFNTLPIAEEDYPPLWYVPKASRAEREAGCEGLPERTGAQAVDREEGSAGLDNPRAGAGRTAAGVKNYHPTVKPIALMRHLCRLVTPPGGIVLDPFMGSGTTGIAARREGFSFIGIERDEGHFAICEARIGAALPPIFGGHNAGK